MAACASLNTYDRILGELATAGAGLDGGSIDTLVREIIAAPRIFCTGAGRSGIMMSAFCMRLNHLGLESYIAGAVPCPPACPGDLVIASSASGTTPTVKAVLARGKEAGARIALFTASPAGAAELAADHVILVPAPAELVNGTGSGSVQPMKTLFEQTVFLLCESIVCTLKGRLSVSEADMAARHANLE